MASRRMDLDAQLSVVSSEVSFWKQEQESSSLVKEMDDIAEYQGSTMTLVSETAMVLIRYCLETDTCSSVGEFGTSDAIHPPSPLVLAPGFWKR